jgi:hypothetical protein
MSELGQSRPFGAPPVNVWVTLDRGRWADTPALLGSAISCHWLALAPTLATVWRRRAGGVRGGPGEAVQVLCASRGDR